MRRFFDWVVSLFQRPISSFWIGTIRVIQVDALCNQIAVVAAIDGAVASMLELGYDQPSIDLALVRTTVLIYDAPWDEDRMTMAHEAAVRGSVSTIRLVASDEIGERVHECLQACLRYRLGQAQSDAVVAEGEAA